MGKRLLMIALIVLLILPVLGCGRPRADVPIFMMSEGGSQADASASLQASLETLVGASPTVSLNISPMFSLDKLMVEIAAGDNAIMIIPEAQFQSFARQGGLVILDDLFNAADYPKGVIEAPVGSSKEEKIEKHLYGVPVKESKWIKDSGYRGGDLYAFVHPRAKNLEMGKQVLKILMGK